MDYEDDKGKKERIKGAMELTLPAVMKNNKADKEVDKEQKEEKSKLRCNEEGRDTNLSNLIFNLIGAGCRVQCSVARGHAIAGSHRNRRVKAGGIVEHG